MADMSNEQAAAAAAVRRSTRTPRNSDEWISTLYALAVTVGAGYFFWQFPDWHSTDVGPYKLHCPVAGAALSRTSDLSADVCITAQPKRVHY